MRFSDSFLSLFQHDTDSELKKIRGTVVSVRRSPGERFALVRWDGESEDDPLNESIAREITRIGPELPPPSLKAGDRARFSPEHLRGPDSRARRQLARARGAVVKARVGAMA